MQFLQICVKIHDDRFHLKVLTNSVLKATQGELGMPGRLGSA